MIFDSNILSALFLFVSSVTIYYLQRLFGPRLVFGRWFNSKSTFNYLVKREDQVELSETDVCSICYSEFSAEVKLDSRTDMPEMTDALDHFLNTNSEKIMKTPCSHYFHISCLITVMNYKQSCPVCRCNLPPIED